MFSQAPLGGSQTYARLGTPDFGHRVDGWRRDAVAVSGWIDAWVSALGSYDVDAMCGLVSPDIVWRDPATLGQAIRGLDSFRAFVEVSLEAFPDIRFRPTGAPFLGEPRYVALPWRITGTFTGRMPMPGAQGRGLYLSPTNRPVDATGLDVYVFREGLLREWTVYYDMLGVARQLGMAPFPQAGLGATAMCVVQRTYAWFLRWRSAGHRDARASSS